MNDKKDHVRFNVPYYPGTTKHYLDQVIEGDESKAQETSALLKNYCGGAEVFLTSNCSSAILMSLIIADVKPGDEVIVSSFTFVTVVNAIRLLGATPKFADIEPESMNLNADDVQRRISDKTKVIIFMGYGGDSAGLSQIKTLAKTHGILLVEDAAYGYMMQDQDSGQPVGTIGDMGCFSFDRTKPYQCVQGGALIISNSDLVEKAISIYNYGTNRSAHMAGDISYYEWTSLGFKFQMNALNASVLGAVLDESNVIKQLLNGIHQRYLTLIHSTELFTTNATFTNQFLLKCKTSEIRDELKIHLHEEGIQAYSHYEPLHLSPFGRAFWEDALPVTELESKKVLRLPYYPGLPESDQEKVCSAVNLAISSMTTHHKSVTKHLQDSF